ncbi:Uncharacterized protein QTN25_002931 [Entamoeba marina]
MPTVVFRIHYATQFGEVLHLWTSKNIIQPMQWTNGHYWKCAIEVEDNTLLEWHYILKEGNRIKREEVMDNERNYLFTQPTVVCDCWSAPDCTDILSFQLKEKIIEVFKDSKKLTSITNENLSLSEFVGKLATLFYGLFFGLYENMLMKQH